MIPDTMKEEIFKPFVRLDKEDEVTTGTGIGLAYHVLWQNYIKVV